MTNRGDETAGRCLLLADGKWVEGEGTTTTLLDKYTQAPTTEVRAASDTQLDAMIGTAERAFRVGAPSAFDRGGILSHAARLVAERADEIIQVAVAESGFTTSDAKGEVTRCAQTLRLSAEEARRLAGEMVPMEGAPNQARRLAFTLRVPLGVVFCVTPFNSPLNTVTHKVAPAFAAGNAVILKPASATPMTACKLAFEMARRLEVGGVHINETSSSRVDLMAYDGSKDSGFGSEGPHYAMHELTEERIVSVTL